ncbi:MAG: acyl-CoA synthetase [Geminicoccaceae bacterium]|nr:acyl-CoA synthetase [Geminicoccaceae bacterium]
MLERASTIHELRRSFRWHIPASMNIAELCCTRHADRSNRPALILHDENRTIGFLDLERRASRLAHVMAAHGVVRGDRVAIFLDQQLDTAAAHIATSKIGAIALPLFRLFGPDALQHRLHDSGAKLVLTDAEGSERIAMIRDELPELATVLVTGVPLECQLENARDRFDAVSTSSNDPAVLIYTSGTSGPPKGALHAQRVLLGHLPGVQMTHEFFPHDGDCFWTPADWAWIGGLLDVLLPSLYFGVPVVATRLGKFDPHAAADLMGRHDVRNAFLPPTSLKLMRDAQIDARAHGAILRSIGSGGERLGDEVLGWAQDSFGVTINEFYGQTECNLVVSNLAQLAAPRAESMGMAVPGHEVAIIDGNGDPMLPGETGSIAVRHPDPVMFLGYWNQPEATRAKFRGNWLVTGDLGRMDEDGFFTYLGREDDLITSAGYRIGPAEVEACLMRHEAVAMCAVIGVPDELRGERVKAFIVLRQGASPGEELSNNIRNFVRHRLAAHEYPREIEFLHELPMTATGKIRRMDLRQLGSGQTRQPVR